MIYTGDMVCISTGNESKNVLNNDGLKIYMCNICFNKMLRTTFSPLFWFDSSSLDDRSAAISDCLSNDINTYTDCLPNSSCNENSMCISPEINKFLLIKSLVITILITKNY